MKISLTKKSPNLMWHHVLLCTPQVELYIDFRFIITLLKVDSNFHSLLLKYNFGILKIGGLPLKYNIIYLIIETPLIIETALPSLTWYHKLLKVTPWGLDTFDFTIIVHILPTYFKFELKMTFESYISRQNSVDNWLNRLEIYQIRLILQNIID